MSYLPEVPDQVCGDERLFDLPSLCLACVNMAPGSSGEEFFGFETSIKKLSEVMWEILPSERVDKSPSMRGISSNQKNVTESPFAERSFCQHSCDWRVFLTKAKRDGLR